MNIAKYISILFLFFSPLNFLAQIDSVTKIKYAYNCWYSIARKKYCFATIPHDHQYYEFDVKSKKCTKKDIDFIEEIVNNDVINKNDADYFVSGVEGTVLKLKNGNFSGRDYSLSRSGVNFRAFSVDNYIYTWNEIGNKSINRYNILTDFWEEMQLPKGRLMNGFDSYIEYNHMAYLFCTYDNDKKSRVYKFDPKNNALEVVFAFDTKEKFKVLSNSLCQIQNKKYLFDPKTEKFMEVDFPKHKNYGFYLTNPGDMEILVVHETEIGSQLYYCELAKMSLTGKVLEAENESSLIRELKSNWKIVMITVAIGVSILVGFIIFLKRRKAKLKK